MQKRIRATSELSAWSIVWTHYSSLSLIFSVYCCHLILLESVYDSLY